MENMALALYNGNKLDRIVLLDEKYKTLVAGVAGELELSLENVTANENSSAKLLIWGDSDDFMKPIDIQEGIETELKWRSL